MMSSTDFSKIPHLALKTDGEPRRLPLENDGTLLIGASSHCKLQLAGQGIRSLHCVVVQKDGRIDLRDWNTGCTAVNGEVIGAPVTLRDGDQIKIAAYEMTVVLPSHSDEDIEVAPEMGPQEIDVEANEGSIGGSEDEPSTETSEAIETSQQETSQQETSQPIEADLQEELNRAHERQQELEDQLLEANQATHSQREACLQMEEQVRELEARIELQKASPNPTATDSPPAVPVELVLALKNQVEVLLTELKSSQQEIATLKADSNSQHDVQNNDQSLESSLAHVQ